MTPKKRCSICRKMFGPDPRIGARQGACGQEACQQQRRARTQASWRSRNPSYLIAYRLEKRAATAADAAVAKLGSERGGDRAGAPPPPSPSPLRLPAVLSPYPWDFAKKALGFAGADLLATLALLMVRLVNAVKDERLVETPLSMRVYTSTGRDP